MFNYFRYIKKIFTLSIAVFFICTIECSHQKTENAKELMNIVWIDSGGGSSYMYVYKAHLETNNSYLTYCEIPSVPYQESWMHFIQRFIYLSDSETTKLQEISAKIQTQCSTQIKIADYTTVEGVISLSNDSKTDCFYDCASGSRTHQKAQAAVELGGGRVWEP
jgi:tRNA A37 threonylcarbamoyladenosine modification protein TsaB